MFWVNENDEEFVLYDKFNSLYRRFKSRMAVNFYDDAELYSDFNSAGSLFERDAPELQEVGFARGARAILSPLSPRLLPHLAGGLRVRGQRTKTTGRKGRTVGVSKKKG